MGFSYPKRQRHGGLQAIGIVMLLIGLPLGIATVYQMVAGNYSWDNDFGSHWELADKSSTLADKAKHLDTFVSVLGKSKLEGSHHAVFYKTPTNSFDANFAAASTLNTRLASLKDAAPDSMAYQQAIQQITAQEQGEGGAMVDTLKGCYIKSHYPLAWAWWCLLAVVLSGALLLFGYFFTVQPD